MKRLYTCILIVIIAISYNIAAHIFGTKRTRVFFDNFNTSNIYGELQYTKIGYHGVVFKIKGIDNEYVFYPRTNELNDNKIFRHIAEKGDIIIKEANSDILKLKKHEKIYIYKFRELDD